MEAVKTGAIWIGKAALCIAVVLLLLYAIDNQSEAFWVGALVVFVWWRLESKLDLIEERLLKVHAAINEIRYPHLRD